MARNGVRTASVLAGMVFGGMSLAAQAVPLDFYCITTNSASNCAIGEAQLAVDVTSYSSNQVLFTFTNTGSFQSTISEIYFDDGTLLGIAELIDRDNGGDLDVAFTQDDVDPVNPPVLPGGDSIFPVFEVTAGFLADADNPAPRWGVSPGEWLGIVFNLESGGTYDDVLAELTDGRLRIGMHVINFSNGGSESFVNNPIPVPAAIWLLGSGLLGLGAIGRRRKA
jgi:hypothetical protein